MSLWCSTSNTNFVIYSMSDSLYDCIHCHVQLDHKLWHKERKLAFLWEWIHIFKVWLRIPSLIFMYPGSKQVNLFEDVQTLHQLQSLKVQKTMLVSKCIIWWSEWTQHHNAVYWPCIEYSFNPYTIIESIQ